MKSVLAISSNTFDLNGNLFLKESDLLIKKTYLSDISRRSTRTATLDGKSSLYDTGYSASDRTITVSVPLDKTDIIDKLEYFVKTYSEMTLILPDGAYKCNPQSFKSTTNATCKLLIIEEI